MFWQVVGSIEFKLKNLLTLHQIRVLFSQHFEILFQPSTSSDRASMVCIQFEVEWWPKANGKVWKCGAHLVGCQRFAIPQHDEAARVTDQQTVRIARLLADSFDGAGAQLEVVGHATEKKMKFKKMTYNKKRKHNQVLEIVISTRSVINSNDLGNFWFLLSLGG